MKAECSCGIPDNLQGDGTAAFILHSNNQDVTWWVESAHPGGRVVISDAHTVHFVAQPLYFRVSFWVSDADGGEPINGAIVTVTDGAGTYTRRTYEDGEISTYVSFPEGTTNLVASVRVEADGYQPVEVRWISTHLSDLTTGVALHRLDPPTP